MHAYMRPRRTNLSWQPLLKAPLQRLLQPLRCWLDTPTFPVARRRAAHRPRALCATPSRARAPPRAATAALRRPSLPAPAFRGAVYQHHAAPRRPRLPACLPPLAPLQLLVVSRLWVAGRSGEALHTPCTAAHALRTLSQCTPLFCMRRCCTATGTLLRVHSDSPAMARCNTRAPGCFGPIAVARARIAGKHHARCCAAPRRARAPGSGWAPNDRAAGTALAWVP